MTQQFEKLWASKALCSNQWVTWPDTHLGWMSTSILNHLLCTACQNVVLRMPKPSELAFFKIPFQSSEVSLLQVLWDRFPPKSNTRVKHQGKLHREPIKCAIKQLQTIQLLFLSSHRIKTSCNVNYCLILYWDGIQQTPLWWWGGQHERTQVRLVVPHAEGISNKHAIRCMNQM